MADESTSIANVKLTARKIVYFVIYLIVLLLLAPTVWWVAMCFMGFLPREGEAGETWIRVLFVTVGVVLIGIQLGVMLVLKKFVPIRTIGVPLGSFMFWAGWTLPILSLAIAVASVVAAMSGVEIEPGHSFGGSGWDWD